MREEKLRAKRTVIESSLTCMCEGAERGNQGQQEKQLSIHCGEDVSRLLGPPSGQRAQHQRPRTRQAHADHLLRRVKG